MADSKLRDLPAITSADIGGDSLVYVVDDPSGTPTDRKATVVDLIASVGVTLSTAQTITGQKTLQATNAGTIAAIVKGAASQTADLQQWQNSAGTVLAKINSVGTGTFQATNAGNAALYAVAGGASTIALVARGAASQTAELQRWENSAGTALTWVTSTGSLIARPSSDSGIESTSIDGSRPSVRAIAGAAGVTPIWAAGAASQTAALQQWRNSAASTLLSVAAAGHLTFADGVNIIAGTTTGTKIGTSSTEKLALWGATPIVRPAGITDASTAHSLVGANTISLIGTEAALNALGTKINSIIANLEALGAQAVA